MGMNVNIEDAEGDEGNESIVAEINITPLTDVFLVLLIIFMVTSTAMVDAGKQTQSGVKVVLPKAKTAGQVTERQTDPILTITKDNKLFLFRKPVTPENLEDELRRAFTELSSTRLLIRGDENVFLGAAVDIMSVAKKAGAQQIAILTQGDEGESGAAPAGP